jgi:hypothetical protein
MGMDGKELERIDREIQKLNKKLGAGFGKITVRRKSMALYARGTFPPKPGETKKWHGDLPLKCRATIPGLQDAQIKAIELSSLLARNKFEWDSQLPSQIIATAATTPVTIQEWVDLQKQDYISSRKRITEDTDGNWLKDYGYVFNKLPLDRPLGVKILVETIELHTTNGTKTRNRSVNAYRRLLLLAGIDPTPIDKLRSRKSELKPVRLRDLPNLETIIEWYHQLPADLRSEFGLRAAFGLRPGEGIEDCDFTNAIEHHEILVYASKTGKQRLVYPYPDRLFDEFDLGNPIAYNSASKSKQQRTSSFRRRLTKLGMPFDLYDLRHQYAFQTTLHNVNPRMACKMMGHSLKTHTEIYNLFWDAKEFREMRAKSQPQIFPN